MPRGDGTGPDGRGRMTGRGAGYCAGYNVPGYVSAGTARGLGLARGFRGGRGAGAGSRAGRPVGPPPAFIRNPQFVDSQQSEDDIRDQELRNLRRVAEDLEDELDAVRGRIDQLEIEA